jgi:hypothetical protein
MTENTTPNSPDKLDQILEKLDRIERELLPAKREVIVNIEKLVESLNRYSGIIHQSESHTQEQVKCVLVEAVRGAE